MDVPSCPRCNTPLDGEGVCVTCRAASQGLVPLTRSGYAEVRKMMDLLEADGLAPEIEQVPARRPEERAHPHWNVYVPEKEAQRAGELLRRDWADLLADLDAARAAERGMRGVDLDAGEEIECPACAHRFTPSSAQAECPDCGLTLGAAAEATPDEAEQS
jgi:hypothetical protein